VDNSRVFKQTDLTTLIVDALEITADSFHELGHTDLAEKYRLILTRILKEKLDVRLSPREE
jgi:hypothetical protein